MNLRLLMLLAITALTCTSGSLLAEEADPGATLKDALTALNVGLRQEAPATKQEALKAILPTQADVELLFPADANLLWPMMDEFRAQMLENIDEVAAEFAPAAIKKIKVVDLRAHEKERAVYTDVFAMIPAEIPAYRAVITTAKGSAGSSTYLLIKDRWIHIQGLEAVPEILKQLHQNLDPR